MGIDNEMVALDSNAMTYLIDGLNCVSGPPLGPESESKRALVQSFLYLPDCSCFHLTPTVEVEYKRIKDRLKRDNHDSWAMVHFLSVHPILDQNQFIIRVHQLQMHHRGHGDCKVLAECEMSGIKALVTRDREFKERLAPQAVGVRVYTPLEYWRSLGIAPGTPPRRIPKHNNPLSRTDWWHA
ncbi:type II toxin-antitoxin system VapC family toxin [Rhodomicrobium sp. Az07]|uniref:type II toxin-antitoxin system VapC family toxin n=1 Tax=Rhodomicrobium sp. Az07 TaxID=2839034 RepID=UPI001BE65D48|nr:type II toxin-antitoxin system VapC family toxin [Rhodomicrobium sp. Az07]MBT3071982.1 type II toxin-antitoxin system VapC family toxin [Rhodomicrobium sp. Az07]